MLKTAAGGENDTCSTRRHWLRPPSEATRPDRPTNVRVTIVGVTNDAPSFAACDQLRLLDPRRLDDRRSWHADSASVAEAGRVVRLLLAR